MIKDDYIGRTTVTETSTRYVDDQWHVIITVRQRRTKNMLDWEEAEISSMAHDEDIAKALTDAYLLIELQINENNGEIFNASKLDDKEKELLN